MGKQDFAALLSKHSVTPSETTIDWDRQKREWLGFIDQFYGSIQKWVEPFVERGELSYRFEEVTLTEENLGSYKVNSMIMDFANQEIVFEPIGTLLIGTKGRIDMEGARGRVQFVLADKDSSGVNISVTVSANDEPDEKRETPAPDWAWKVVTRQPRAISYTEFNEDNFFDSLMEIING